MSQKRIRHHRQRSSDQQRPDRSRQPGNSTDILEKNLLACLYDLHGQATINALVKGTAASRSSKDDIVAITASLMKKNQIVKTGKNCFILNKNANLFEAILDKNPRNFTTFPCVRHMLH